MKSVPSLTLALCLGSTLPAVAQDAPADGPLARSITREAARLAPLQQNPSADAGWSRVRSLAPGTQLVLTVKGSQPETRYFLRADECDLTVLNVTDLALPADVRDVLRDIASHHAEYVSAVQQGKTFSLAKNVRIGPDGVFVPPRRVADTEHVFEQIARDAIAEISGPAPYSPRHDALVGFASGFLTIVGIGTAYCRGNCGSGELNVLGAGALLGGINAGLFVGIGAAQHARQNPVHVVYPTP